MKQIILILLVLITLCSCKKETLDPPDYQPGRLTEILYETYELGSIQHKYEYAINEIIDRYYFSSTEIFISKYHISNDQLKKVNYSFENTSEDFYIDSLTYYYSDSQIIEITHMSDNECDTIVYFLEYGKITSSTNKPTSSSSDWRVDCFYEWSGDNLIRYEVHLWYLRPSPIVRKYVFQYSGIENPLFCSNIPRLMNEFINPRGGNNYELSDLVPKCSRNLPLKLTIYDSTIPEHENSYSLESKTFRNVNKPYEVKVTHDEYFTQDYDYFLTYEEL